LKVAKHRSKREITRLVRQLDPLPAVLARIEPLGPTLAGTSANNASWEAYMHALNPVRELPPERCPNNWSHLAEDSAAAGKHSREPTELPGARAHEPAEQSGAPERASSLSVQRYAVQFTACQEYVDLLERARDLLSHAVPDRSLVEVHLRAMRLLVAELEKRKFGVSGEPCRRGVRGKNEAAVSAESKRPELGDEQRRPGETSRAEIDVSQVSPSATQPDFIDRGDTRANEDASEQPRSAAKVDTLKTPRRCQPHGMSPPADDAAVTARYVPARVRREVYPRDGARCAFVSADGVRCRETSLLELHHVTPHARNGATTADNLALYCRAHNALAAEHDFGRAFMAGVPVATCVRRHAQEGGCWAFVSAKLSAGEWGSGRSRSSTPLFIVASSSPLVLRTATRSVLLNYRPGVSIICANGPDLGRWAARGSGSEPAPRTRNGSAGQVLVGVRFRQPRTFRPGSSDECGKSKTRHRQNR
ncbi:MAG TPA: HNH endonuclease signature motif containing protein, partial [Polyangiaceae bacterium]